MAAVDFVGVSHRHPGTFDAVVELDLEVRDGELAALVGPAGSGAATTLRLLAGFEDPARGSIRIGDREVAGLAPRDRNVALVLPHHALYPHLTVADHLTYPLSVADVPEPERGARIREVARSLRMADVLDSRPAALGPTQRQRVAIGRAIVRRPDVLLMDDPLGGLAGRARADAQAELQRLRDELAITTLAVVAEVDDARAIGGRVLRFDRGRCTAPAFATVPA